MLAVLLAICSLMPPGKADAFAFLLTSYCVQVKSKSALGIELESIMKEGKLVPQETTIALSRKAMVGSGCNRFLVDGFPRALDQVNSQGQATAMPCLHQTPANVITAHHPPSHCCIHTVTEPCTPQLVQPYVMLPVRAVTDAGIDES